MSDQKRPYRLNARAEQQARTRQRITESAAALHGSLGPVRTSMSAVAAHAGVRRSTLYRHFADEETLFAACSSHWASQHPLPDLAAWEAIEAPDKRLRVALEELYEYYEGGASMLANIHRDMELVPAVRRSTAPFQDYMAAAREVLLSGRSARGRPAHTTRAAVGHALAFYTWRSLVQEQGCSRAQAVALMSALVSGQGS